MAMTTMQRIGSMETALDGPDLGALDKRRRDGTGPAAHWHAYGEHEGDTAACDPYASILPVLAMLLGPSSPIACVIEVGGGEYSTPLLAASTVLLRTIETREGWARRCGPYHDRHAVLLTTPEQIRTDPDGVLHEAGLHATDGDDTLLVLDGGPTEADRIPMLLSDAARCARWIVLHDAQDSAYAGIDWSRWKHAVMVKNHLVWTAVVSDHADPMLELGRLPGAKRVESGEWRA